MGRSKLALVVGIGIAAAVYAASTLFTYNRFNFATQAQETVTSNFDIPNASLTQSQASGVSRYEVEIPATAALKNGEFLVQLVLGNRQSGMSDRVLYATFGQEARIGGDWPIEGTQAIVLNGNGDKVADATAVVEGDALVIKVATSDISNGSVLSATLFGQDAPLGLKKDQVPFWRNFATKTLVSDWGDGTFVLPPIPGEGGQPPFEEAGLQSSLQNEPPPSIPDPRDITPKNWGPPTGRWQPNPPVPPAEPSRPS